MHRFLCSNDPHIKHVTRIGYKELGCEIFYRDEKFTTRLVISRYLLVLIRYFNVHDH